MATPRPPADEELADELYFPPTAIQAANPPCLVFLITGNPGLIEYYRTFLSHLKSTLDTRNPSIAWHVKGVSLAGFELRHNSGRPFSFERCKFHEWGNEDGGPYTVDRQISFIKKEIKATTHDMAAAPPVPVVLVGHSIGAFMLLEVISRLQKKSQSLSAPCNKGEIVGGVCLFPTVVDIAKSPTGRRAAPLLAISGLPYWTSWITWLLTLFTPRLLLTLLVGLITRMPFRAARITAAFLASPTGVRQALFMGGDEMRRVQNDTWSDDMWGIHPDREARAAIKKASNILNEVTNSHTPSAASEERRDSARRTSSVVKIPKISTKTKGEVLNEASSSPTSPTSPRSPTHHRRVSFGELPSRQDLTTGLGADVQRTRDSPTQRRRSSSGSSSGSENVQPRSNASHFHSQGTPEATRQSPLSASRPKLAFYFGKNDHWVAEETRKNLISNRGRRTSSSSLGGKTSSTSPSPHCGGPAMAASSSGFFMTGNATVRRVASAEDMIASSSRRISSSATAASSSSAAPSTAATSTVATAVRAPQDPWEGKDLRPIMDVDEYGIPHSFCLEELHSKIVAEKCAGYIVGMRPVGEH